MCVCVSVRARVWVCVAQQAERLTAKIMRETDMEILGGFFFVFFLISGLQGSALFFPTRRLFLFSVWQEDTIRGGYLG